MSNKIFINTVKQMPEFMTNSDGKRKYYIFGAHSRAQTLSMYFRSLYPDWFLAGFFYDNEEENPAEVDGVPVYKITENGLVDSCGAFAEYDKNADVYVGTRGVFFDHAQKALQELGFTRIFFYDQELDNRLRNKFIPEYYKERGWEFRKIDALVKERHLEAAGPRTKSIFVVKSAADSELNSGNELKKYECYIQAGKALTDIKLSGCDIFDDIGDNISERNPQMCELTAMYWIWKNVCKTALFDNREEFVGLEHYRRRFILPEGWENVIRNGAADVILPVPLFVNPSVRDNYCGRHTSFTWDVMMEVLTEKYPEHVEKVKLVFESSGCYCPCNMLIARKEVFNEMCSWLFPILFTVMERCGAIDDKYQNRYPGFLAERLITLFFRFNEARYNIVYADKVFLG